MRKLLTSTLFSLSLFGFGISNANTVQDQQGVGSRAKAMGGASTAFSNDASAVYYNPASLSNCQSNLASIELNHWVYGLAVESESDALTTDELRDRTALSLSACIHLPYRLSAGFLFDTGLSNVQSLNQSTLNSTPEFALYGKPLEQISMMGGISYQVNNQLSVGVGGALLVNSGLQVSAEIPIISGEREVAGGVQWTLDPAAAFYGGIRYQVSKPWTIAASVRTALFHKLEAQARTRVDVAGVLVDVDLLLENVAWYSPLQAAIGAAYSPNERTTVAADLTWYHWSAYPGPFIQISPLDPDDGVAAGLTYPVVEEPDFRDVVIPRVGLEHLATAHLTLRSGLSYKQTPAPRPKAQSRANLLDASVATLSIGAGYTWTHSLSRSDRIRDSIASTTIDFHTRLHRMDTIEVRKVIEVDRAATYRFGGYMYDAGVTIAVRW